jgi:hypothetical protein
MTAILASFALLVVFESHAPCSDEKGGPVRVTVVVVLASTQHDEINPKIKTLADEIRKREPKLTGFRMESVLQHSLALGESHTFSLPEKLELKVTIHKSKDKNNRVGLGLVPPGLDEIAYTCTCEKFFPVLTPKKIASGERLIIAVMAKPCTGKGP